MFNPEFPVKALFAWWYGVYLAYLHVLIRRARSPSTTGGLHHTTITVIPFHDPVSLFTPFSQLIILPLFLPSFSFSCLLLALTDLFLFKEKKSPSVRLVFVISPEFPASAAFYVIKYHPQISKPSSPAHEALTNTPQPWPSAPQPLETSSTRSLMEHLHLLQLTRIREHPIKVPVSPESVPGAY